MKIMNKILLSLICLTLPIASIAADLKAGVGSAQSAKPNAPAASAPAPKARPIDSRASVQVSKDRSRLMGSCRDKADAVELGNIERRQFMANCMSGK
jgi:hypothetical protein